MSRSAWYLLCFICTFAFARNSKILFVAQEQFTTEEESEDEVEVEGQDDRPKRKEPEEKVPEVRRAERVMPVAPEAPEVRRAERVEKSEEPAIKQHETPTAKPVPFENSVSQD